LAVEGAAAMTALAKIPAINKLTVARFMTVPLQFGRFSHRLPRRPFVVEAAIG
jgi:hypothetical protein